MSEFKFTDFTDLVLEAFGDATARALTRCGKQGEDFAKDLCIYKTGNLKNSITHRVVLSEPAAYIGTNVEYAGYVEFGTGSESTIGGGTPKTHWAYMGEDGEWHIGKPMKAHPFLKPAVANHVGTYRNIFVDEFTK